MNCDLSRSNVALLRHDLCANLSLSLSLYSPDGNILSLTLYRDISYLTFFFFFNFENEIFVIFTAAKLYFLQIRIEDNFSERDTYFQKYLFTPDSIVFP